MTPTRTVAAAGTLSLVAGLLVGAEPGAAAMPAHHKSAKFTLTEIQTSYKDTFGDGFDTGDSFSYTAKLLRDGKKVGTDKATCTIESLQGPTSEPTGGKLRCKLTFKLKAGKVKARGVDKIDFNDPTPKFRFPIVSGTGKYADADGRMTVLQLTEIQTSYKDTFGDGFDTGDSFSYTAKLLRVWCSSSTTEHRPAEPSSRRTASGSGWCRDRAARPRDREEDHRGGLGAARLEPRQEAAARGPHRGRRPARRGARRARSGATRLGSTTGC